MGGILITLGSVGVLCASGVVVTTALRWFHMVEIDVSRGRKNKGGFGYTDSPHRDRLESINKRMKHE